MCRDRKKAVCFMAVLSTFVIVLGIVIAVLAVRFKTGDSIFTADMGSSEQSEQLDQI